MSAIQLDEDFSKEDRWSYQRDPNKKKTVYGPDTESDPSMSVIPDDSISPSDHEKIMQHHAAQKKGRRTMLQSKNSSIRSISNRSEINVRKLRKSKDGKPGGVEVVEYQSVACQARADKKSKRQTIALLAQEIQKVKQEYAISKVAKEKKDELMEDWPIKVEIKTNTTE